MPTISTTVKDTEDNKENNCSKIIKDQKGKKDYLIKV